MALSSPTNPHGQQQQIIVNIAKWMLSIGGSSTTRPVLRPFSLINGWTETLAGIAGDGEYGGNFSSCSRLSASSQYCVRGTLSRFSELKFAWVSVTKKGKNLYLRYLISACSLVTWKFKNQVDYHLHGPEYKIKFVIFISTHVRTDSVPFIWIH